MGGLGIQGVLTLWNSEFSPVAYKDRIIASLARSVQPRMTAGRFQTLRISFDHAHRQFIAHPRIMVGWYM
jgi:hypothetical protein